MAYSISKAEFRERLVNDIALWQADGLISPAVAAELRERYESRQFGLGQVMRYAGIIGMVFVGLGILGLVGAATGSELAAGLVLLLAGGGAVIQGARLAQDRRGRYPWSSKAVLTFGAMLYAGGTALVLDGIGVDGRGLIFAWGLLVIPALVAAAYSYRIGFLLVLALIAFFHWVGSWNAMLGRSTYAMSIQDPRIMSLVALGVVGIGLWHERDEDMRERSGRFFAAYQAMGLLYLNMSLLVLSIQTPGVWTFALAGAGVAQILAGGRLHSSLFIGFGVTFTFINGFTRYYEHFWDPSTKGLFFLLGGGITLAAGLFLEGLLRAAQEDAA